MIHEELYIIVDGARKKLDLPSPSGITLNFVSNLFNDLSKINASYSYTFKLPRTANNVRVLELVDDVRADGKFTRIKNDAEFVYDGVSLFANANMYISDVENDTISAVLTWNVNKGLQELNKNDMSLNELGNHLPEGEYDYVGDAASNYEKDKIVPMGVGTYDVHSGLRWDELKVLCQSQGLIRPRFDKYADYNPANPYATPLYNGGVAPYILAPEAYAGNYSDRKYIRSYPLYEDYDDHKLSPMQVICTEDSVLAKRLYTYKDGEKKYPEDDKGNILLRAYAFPNPVVPVPYLMDVIGSIYGISFDIDNDMYRSLCVPLATANMSDALSRLNYIRLGFGVNDVDGLFLYGDATLVENYPGINPIGDVHGVSYDLGNTPIGIMTPGVTFSYCADERWGKLKAFISGKVVFKVAISGEFHQYSDDKYPKLTVWCRSYDPERVDSVVSFNDDSLYEIGTIKATNVRYVNTLNPAERYEEITFNLSLSEGYEAFETEAFYRTALFFQLSYGDNGRYEYDLDYQPQGYFNIAIKAVDYPAGCKINLFQNLPDISVLDFVKSIFYAIGTYPYQDADGVIRAVEYRKIIQSITDGNINNWSSKCLSGIGRNEEEFGYNANDVTGLTLGRKNYFLMKNDKIDEEGNEESNKEDEDAYEHGYACIKLESSVLDDRQTIYTFPFYGGFLWSKGFYAQRKDVRDMPLAEHYVEYFNGYEIWDGDFGISGVVGTDKWHIKEDTYQGNGDEGGYGGGSAQDLFPRSRGLKFRSSDAKPMLGVIQPLSVPIARFSEEFRELIQDTYVTTKHIIQATGDHTNYLSMRVWNCANDMPMVNGRNLLQELFGNPCLVKEDMNLNVMDLATLDVEKPVYLEKYNSYFAIKNIEVGSDGISKVELIRIPPELFDPAAPTPEIVVEEPALENGGDNGGSFEVVDPWAEP